MSKLNFHVRHEVTPDRVWSVLEAVAEGFDYEHVTQSDRQLSRLRQLDLVTSRGDLALTPRGQQVYQFGMQKPNALADLWHYLHYTHWRSAQSRENTMFYTYRAYSDLLHEKGRASLHKDMREIYTAELNGHISSEPIFEGFETDLQKGAVSLSPNSLRGVEHWLENLSPSVIEDGHFERRHFCIAELAVLALGYVTQASAAELGIEQLLTPEKRMLICRLCMLDESALDQTLDWTLPAFPQLVQAGTSAGSFGRFIRILKVPTLEDLLV